MHDALLVITGACCMTLAYVRCTVWCIFFTMPKVLGMMPAALRQVA